jgi:secreted PhoX family phosphatase
MLHRSLDRRAFLRQSALLSGLAALGWRAARGEMPPATRGYGPLVDKGALWLPEAFDFQIISWSDKPMSDGALTPGSFDGMGAFPVSSAAGNRRVVLIRNHEIRGNPGAARRVTTGADLEYDPQTHGGNTKLLIERHVGPGRKFTYQVIEDYAILGGTTTNCAGGELLYKKWVTCEEAVFRSASGRKHGYIFEIDAEARGPIRAEPVRAAGRFCHEATAWRAGVLYLTEDRGIGFDPRLGLAGACFYRYLPEARQTRRSNLAHSRGRLQALKIRGEDHANLNVGRPVGVPLPVEWVTIEEPDHDDDTDFRTDRQPGFTPTRLQAQDQGAAFFSRLEGAWARGIGRQSKIYFDATSGGAAGLGQVWEYDIASETLTLLYESTSPATLRHPDNLVVLPMTGDLLLCEDAGGEQYIRGLTAAGEIYDFAKTATNTSEFCGACFDRGTQTLFVNQQGSGAFSAPPGADAVTYAIFGPFLPGRPGASA